MIFVRSLSAKGAPAAIPLRLITAAAVCAFLVLSAAGVAEALERESDSFAWYQFFLGGTGGPTFWFRTEDQLAGPVHTNGILQINGDPWFGSTVTAGGSLTFVAGSDPVFECGYILGFPIVELPTAAEVRSTLRTAAIAGGLYAPPLGDDTYYEVVLGEPSLGLLTYQAHDNAGNPAGPAVVVDILSLNGAAWFEETVKIHGVLDGVLTVGSERWIEITDDLVYSCATPGSGPDPDCDDMLGLIAVGEGEGDIIVANTAPNQDDCEIHAAMMALDKRFEVEDWQTGPPRGELTVYGGIIVGRDVLTGQYNYLDVLISGYVRDQHYDERLREQAPPFFPERPSVSGVDDGAAELNLAPCSPNPFRGTTVIRFSAPPGVITGLDVFDSGGRLIKRLADDEPLAGRHITVWDGTDGSGRCAASGVYFIRARAGGETKTAKVVLLR